MSDIPISADDIATANAPGTIPAPTPLDAYRAANPAFKDDSDYVLSRKLFEDGQANPKESYPEFATRIGVQQAPLETALNRGLTTAAFGLNNPIEAGLSGLGGLLTGGSFGDSYKAKRQELADQDAVGNFQNSKSDLAGNLAGTVADYARLGPVLRSGAEFVPGMSKVAESGPLGDSIAKFFGLSEANEIPKLLEQQALEKDTPIGERAGQIGGGLATAGAEGVGSALLGSAASKGLGAVAAPLARSVGQGLIAADDAMAGVPRSIYTKAAANLASGFNGSTSPMEAAHDIDSSYYADLLSRSGINVDKGVKQLTDMMMNKPGYSTKVMGAAETSLPDSASQPMRDALADTIESINNGEPGAADKQQTVLSDIVRRLDASDPTGKDSRDFIGNLYARLIPDRLSGPFDPSASFDRNMISGALSDKGRLIQPPITGLGSIGQTLYERAGGGAGRVMWPMLAAQPKAAVGGAASVVGQVPSLVLRGLGHGLDAAGVGIDAAGQPGIAAGDAIAKIPGVQNLLPDGFMSPANKQIGDFTKTLPSVYANATHSLLTNNPQNQPLFPDTYTPPTAPQQHTELPTGAAVQEWLGSTDRGSATAFIGQKLGPDVAKQLASTDDSGFKAAIFNLSSDPRYRTQLSSSAPSQDDATGGAGDIIPTPNQRG